MAADDLTEWAASDTRTVRPDATIYRGDAARAASRALLEHAAGDDPASLALVRRASRGRPRLDPGDPTGGPAPTWSVRAPRALDTAVRDLAARQGREVRDVIRDAAAEYVERHAG